MLAKEKSGWGSGCCSAPVFMFSENVFQVIICLAKSQIDLRPPVGQSDLLEWPRGCEKDLPSIGQSSRSIIKQGRYDLIDLRLGFVWFLKPPTFAVGMGEQDLG